MLTGVEAIENGGGDGGVAEILAQITELDVGDDGGGEQPEIDEASEHMGSGQRISVGGADEIEDDDRKPGQATQSALVGAVGEARSRG